jgi:dipeptidyl aminopeptidase/acylaminoacyl peptidase
MRRFREDEASARGSVAAWAPSGSAVGRLLGYLYVHPPRLPVLSTPARYGLSYEHVWLTASDGTRLAAWYVPCPGARAAVILCHGYSTNRQAMLDLIPPLHRAGFHVLAFDFRALGESEGAVCTLGRQERLDVLAAVDYLMTQPEVDPDRIGALGWSMGAAACLMAAAESRDLRAVVADSSFARLDGMAEERLRPLPRFVRDPLARSSRDWAERFSGYAAAEVVPVAAVGRMAPRPLLIIHGEQDRLIPVAQARMLYASAPAPCELWTVPGARHVRAHARHRDAYERRVIAFFRRHLPAPQGEEP